MVVAQAIWPDFWFSLPGDAPGLRTGRYDKAVAAVEALDEHDGRIPPKRECPNCAQWFRPKRRGQRYCDTGKCRTVGPSAVYARTLSPLKDAYRKEYRRLDNRQRRGKFSRDDLAEWRLQAGQALTTAETDSWPVEKYRAHLAHLVPQESET